MEVCNSSSKQRLPAAHTALPQPAATSSTVSETSGLPTTGGTMAKSIGYVLLSQMYGTPYHTKENHPIGKHYFWKTPHSGKFFIVEMGKLRPREKKESIPSHDNLKIKLHMAQLFLLLDQCLYHLQANIHKLYIHIYVCITCISYHTNTCIHVLCCLLQSEHVVEGVQKKHNCLR